MASLALLDLLSSFTVPSQKNLYHVVVIILLSLSFAMASVMQILRFSAPAEFRATLLRCRSLRSTYHRSFHKSAHRHIVKPFLLADIGEGTRECQIIQWFVEPGARVEQFDKLCEVQSDKAATDITSPFDGIIKKLYYEADDMAIVGKPLVDIDIQNEFTEQDAEKLGDTPQPNEQNGKKHDQETAAAEIGKQQPPETLPDRRSSEDGDRMISKAESERRTLATPAVRHLTKQLNVNIADIDGTGKNGRVTKEDVHRQASQATQATQATQPAALRDTGFEIANEDKVVTLTPVQRAMFKSMTKSLSIPHFLYSLSVDVTPLTRLRQRLNQHRERDQRLTPLPFILKAVSLAFTRHPLLNASMDTSDPDKPVLTYRAAHDFGIGVDSPSGLLVPVIRNVETKSVGELARTIKMLSQTAHQGKLQSSDFHGASFTVSNIGSIGGGVVAPVIVQPQLAIVGIGRSKVVPAFDESGELVKREEFVMSWSADHRIVDGAECARAAEKVKDYLENIESWVLEMR